MVYHLALNFTKMAFYVYTTNSCSGDVNFNRFVTVFKCFGWQMDQYESGIKTMR